MAHANGNLYSWKSNKAEKVSWIRTYFRESLSASTAHGMYIRVGATKAVTRVPFAPTSSHVNVIVSLSPGAQVTIFKVCLLTSGVHSSVGVAYGDGSKYMSLECSGKMLSCGGGTGDFMYIAPDGTTLMF